MESQRQLLEELEAFEAATALRYRRNPLLVGKTHVDGKGAEGSLATSSRKRPHKETLLLQHELKYFGDRYDQNCKRIAAGRKNPLLRKDIDELKDDEMTFSAFNERLRMLRTKLTDTVPKSAEPALAELLLFSSAPEDEKRLSKDGKQKAKRKHVLSRAGSHLGDQLASAFSEAEMLGNRLELSVFYEKYKLLSATQLSYLDYLRSFDKPAKLSGKEFLQYLESLASYLERFYKNLHPFEEVVFESKPETEVEDGKPDENGQVFCKACNKTFPKESVYKGHLDGKKHKKNAANGSSAPATETMAAVVARTEKKIHLLAEKLKNVREDTILDQERLAVMTDREKMLEGVALEGEESEYTDCESGDEQSDDDDNDDHLLLSHLPLGTDGVPIPLWLYKLQGLHQSFNCEICGNYVYRGRQQFDKHFGSTRHVRGLSYLGVSEEEMGKFAGISTIEEATELWLKIKKEKRTVEMAGDNAIEIEDESGDVMTMKDYNDLKRQGLL